MSAQSWVAYAVYLFNLLVFRQG